MISRLALVIGWTATATAILFAALGLFGLLNGGGDQLVCAIFLVISMFIYAAGRAVRFVLIGN